MEDMIKRLLEVDRLAREAKSVAQRENLTLEDDINKKKKEIKEDYLNRARERIEQNKVLEEDAAKKKIEEANILINKKVCDLDNEKQKNFSMWTSEVLYNILGKYFK